MATRWDNEFADHVGMYERSEHTEQAAFMRLMLLDDVKDRLDEAQEIRVLPRAEDLTDPQTVADEYAALAQRQADMISSLIKRVREELDKIISEVA